MGRAAATRSGRLRFATLALGVLVMHTLVTILEERLFTIPAFREHSGGAFMTLFMYSFTVVAYVPRARGQSLPPNAFKALAFVSTIYVGTTTLTKTSLRYLDMPTQTVLKSAKLLPVMAGSILILGRRYSRAEWLAAFMLCAGVVIFNMSTNFPAFQSTMQGGICIGVALTCDAMLGNYQQKVMSSGVSSDQLMLYQSVAGMLYMLVVTLADGTLFPGVDLLLHDVEVSSMLILWAIAITAGTALVLKLVAEYSAVVAIVVTTVRKALTLIASFILFPKHLGIGHPIGAALVFGSAFVAHAAKGKTKSKDAKHGATASAGSSNGANGASGAGARVSEQPWMPKNGSTTAANRCTNVV